jgi:hypothetical protein
MGYLTNGVRQMAANVAGKINEFVNLFDRGRAQGEWGSKAKERELELLAQAIADLNLAVLQIADYIDKADEGYQRDKAARARR